MAHTIHFEHDFVSAEELQLLKTKQAILEKLRLRFGEMAHPKALAGAKTSTTKGSSHKRAERDR